MRKAQARRLFTVDLGSPDRASDAGRDSRGAVDRILRDAFWVPPQKTKALAEVIDLASRR
jgi:hypothetical protein